jgi:hypothetical protein
MYSFILPRANTSQSASTPCRHSAVLPVATMTDAVIRHLTPTAEGVQWVKNTAKATYVRRPFAAKPSGCGPCGWVRRFGFSPAGAAGGVNGQGYRLPTDS